MTLAKSRSRSSRSRLLSGVEAITLGSIGVERRWSRAAAKLGWRSSDTHPLNLDDVRVPADALLGTEGAGYREALKFLTWARLPIARGLGLPV